MTRKPVLRLLAVLALTLLALPVLAEIGPEGRELRVNQRTDFKQRNPAVAFSPSGGSLTVWENEIKGLRGQLFGPDGLAAGAELSLIANETLGTLPAQGTVVSRRQPSFVFTSVNEIALAWTEETAFVRSSPFIEGREVIDQDVFVQSFNASGAPVGERIRVNTATKGLQREPRLMAAGARLLVVWEDDQGGIFGRFLGPNRTAAFKINSAAGTLPEIAGGGNRFLAVWQGSDGSETGIFARVFDGTGSPIGSEFRVNTNTVGRQRRHSVAVDNDGSFFVVWQHDVSKVESRLFSQLVGRAGNLIGGQTALHVDEDHLLQMAPKAIATGPDRFLVTWMTFLTPWSGVLVAGREVDSKGTLLGDMFMVSERQVERNFRRTALAADGTGRFLVGWETVTGGRVGIGARRLGD